MNQAWNWLKNQLTHREPTGTATRCFWQTDVHSHLIPGIDDGVKTIDQSLTCIRQLSEWGIQKIITTPHVSHDHYPNDTVGILEGLDFLRQQVDREGIPVQIDVAAEYLLDDFFLQRLDSASLLTFGAERYLLVETGWLARPLLLDEMIFRIQTNGYTPILAHPERYPYYINDSDGMARLRDLGCLFQLNWMSLSGRYGPHVRNQAKVLLKNKWVDFIGSDVHRPEDLPALLALFSSPAFELLAQQPLRNGKL
ncbi:tyrosine-protein phosphatase [Spirosoma validum]|uniref:protein-tyrosine-phosphatase n=1 Tax=Spirosoma validum TaxID=2771355 RepID=A0A927B124_9BACT|nr:CpsB/CapC family capsule biosynthesis tyrosine phosphatase [Spirosoma validum]MBD2753297.1 histidinol-phosphatase [Spirosoma validum]